MFTVMSTVLSKSVHVNGGQNAIGYGIANIVLAFAVE
jgi:hypothetical protein